MKAVAPRIERLYESQAQRWHKEWKHFFDQLWRPLSDRELQAYIDYLDLPEARQAEIAPIIQAWTAKAGGDGNEEPMACFLDGYFEAMPEDFETVDLSRWPWGVPLPPAEMPDLWQIVRQEALKSEDERLASGWVLFQLAAVRVARLYGRTSESGGRDNL